MYFTVYSNLYLHNQQFNQLEQKKVAHEKTTYGLILYELSTQKDYKGATVSWLISEMF